MLQCLWAVKIRLLGYEGEGKRTAKYDEAIKCADDNVDRPKEITGHYRINRDSLLNPQLFGSVGKHFDRNCQQRGEALQQIVIVNRFFRGRVQVQIPEYSRDKASLCTRNVLPCTCKE